MCNCFSLNVIFASFVRANVEKDHIKPIATSLQALQLKRNVALNKALEELKRHQQLLTNSPEKKSPHKKEYSPHKKAKKKRSSSASSSRSNSASRSRPRKGSVSSDEASDNEVDEGSSSHDECPTSSSPKVPRFKVLCKFCFLNVLQLLGESLSFLININSNYNFGGTLL